MPAPRPLGVVSAIQLIELFDSEDPREREYLKTILHRIYGVRLRVMLAMQFLSGGRVFQRVVLGSHGWLHRRD